MWQLRQLHIFVGQDSAFHRHGELEWLKPKAISRLRRFLWHHKPTQYVQEPLDAHSQADHVLPRSYSNLQDQHNIQPSYSTRRCLQWASIERHLDWPSPITASSWSQWGILQWPLAIPQGAERLGEPPRVAGCSEAFQGEVWQFTRTSRKRSYQGIIKCFMAARRKEDFMTHCRGKT